MKKKYCIPEIEIKCFRLSADILGNSVEHGQSASAGMETGNGEATYDDDFDGLFP